MSYDPRDEPDKFVPWNLEAEQALLGCLMFSPESFHLVDPLINEGDFYEPFHGRLYAKIVKLTRADRLADPITLRTLFSIDPAFEDLGGIRYLADLVDRAPPAADSPHYAKEISSLALRREAIRVANEVIKAARDPDVSGGDLMAHLEKGVSQARSGRDDVVLLPWGDVSAGIVDRLDKPLERPLLSTGLKKIDKMIGGGERGDLIIVGARPSMGKSALASCIALNVASNGVPSKDGLIGGGTVEINGEMSVEQMGRRHLTDECFRQYMEQSPVYRDIRLRTLSDHQIKLLRQTHDRIKGLPLAMVKRTGLTLGRLRALLRRQKMLFESQGVSLDLVIIDHVGLIKTDEQGRARYEDQTVISATMKELGEELDCVMMGLAQLNRNVEAREDKRPQLSDLRDSGSWEQDADVVLGVYRDAYYAQREREPKKREDADLWFLRTTSREIEAIGLKVREGAVGTAKLWSDIGRNAIRDEDPDGWGAPPSLF